MNIKIKCLILFLLYLSQEISSLCQPCYCDTERVRFSNDYQRTIVANHGWYFQKTNPDIYRMVCRHHWRFVNVTYDLPSDAPWNLQGIFLRGNMPFCKRNGITRQMFQKFKTLEFLIIGPCEAKTIDKDVLVPHRNTLREAYFYSNFIRDFPIGMFQQAPLLWAIDLFNNRVESIKKGFFANLVDLRMIRFQYNEISFIEVGAFHNTPNLLWININHNKLSYVDANIFENYGVFTHAETYFESNPFFCNEKLCPFMNHAKQGLTCAEPVRLINQRFDTAIKHIGTKAIQVRHVVDYEKSVKMQCSTCGLTKLSWKKIGSDDLPPGVSISQAQGDRISILKIDKVIEEHAGNYSCYRPDCTTADCPQPIIALIVELAEPVWNFTGGQGKIDEVVRYGDKGLVLGLFPLAIYTIIMAVCMSAYLVYKKVMKNRARAEQT